VEVLVLVAFSCAECHGGVLSGAFPRPCSEACRREAGRQSRRRHQQSPEGRADHRDRSAAARARKREKAREMARVTEDRSLSLPHAAESCVPVEAQATTEAAVVLEARRDDGNSPAAGDAASPKDAALGDGRDEGAHEGGAGAGALAGSPGGGDAGPALWHRRPLAVALCVGERGGSSSTHLFGALAMASPALDYTVGVVAHDPPGTDRTAEGLGPFGDLRLVCRGLL